MVTADNGSSGEGGLAGTFNENRIPIHFGLLFFSDEVDVVEPSYVLSNLQKK